MTRQSLITIDPKRRSGKPCISDTRITVYDMLEYLATGMSETEIVADFPELTKEGIRACLSFAADASPASLARLTRPRSANL